jgi:hypothetical protein
MDMNAIEDRVRAALEPYHADIELPSATRAEGPGRRPRRRLYVASVAAAAAVIALTAVLLPALLPGGVNPAAASILQGFAAIARHAPAEPAPQAGQYVYTETRSVESYLLISGDGKYRFVYSIPQTTQQWLGLDGSGRQVTTTGTAPSFPTAADRERYEAYVASGGPELDGFKFDLGATSTESFGPGQLSWTDTSNLPTDPAALGRLIDDRKIVDGPSGDWESFALATDLIRNSYARPELRAALYSYMAGLSGIQVLGDTIDARGRQGVALASSHDGMQYVVVFDPLTGKILEEREIVLKADQGVYSNPGPGESAYASDGEALYVATYLSSAEVVGSVGQTPN